MSLVGAETYPGWDARSVTVDGVRVHVRTSAPASPDSGATPVVHVHGFGISGRYLMPTARLLVGRGLQIVPDMPGYGRSGDPAQPLSIPQLGETLHAVLDALGLDTVVLLGNSMGCPVILEAAFEQPERIERVVLVSPAGGPQNQPLRRGAWQLVKDSPREPVSMGRVAVPDYLRFGPFNALRLFRQLVAYPSLDRLLGMPVPGLAVLGDRDPLMPGRARVMEVARAMPPHVTVVQIEGAAHALNYSHPGELANVVSCWLDDREIIDDPDQPGLARVLPIPRD